jgi:two-component system, LytTR family, response regulator
VLRVIIIDDEQNAREAITTVIQQYTFGIEIVAEASTVREGIEQIKKYRPDLILLDIELTDGNGFEILERMDPIHFKVIFITAFHEYAIQAIKSSALDYIVKPVQPRELINALDKAKEAVVNEHLQLQVLAFLKNIKSDSESPEKLILKTAESIFLIDVKEIIRCESDKNYTTFIMNDGRKLLVSKTLKEFDELLTRSHFFRTHQSHLINLQYFVRYDKSDGGFVVMSDNSKVPVSLRKKDDFIKVLENFGR